MVSDGPAAPSPGGSAAVGHPSSGPDDPVGVVCARLAESLALARRAGIPPDAIVIDPGIGFFRRSGMAWHEWDVAVLAGLGRLRALGRPHLCRCLAQVVSRRLDRRGRSRPTAAGLPRRDHGGGAGRRARDPRPTTSPRPSRPCGWRKPCVERGRARGPSS